MNDNQIKSTNTNVIKRGGPRVNAGRKKRDLDVWMEARGLHPATAMEILNNANERKLWHRILISDDDRIVLDGLKFLTMMRDGKPAQQINVTSTTVNLSVDEIARARNIVREIIGEHEYRQPPILTATNIDTHQSTQSQVGIEREKPIVADATPPTARIQMQPYAGTDEGGKKEG